MAITEGAVVSVTGADGSAGSVTSASFNSSGGGGMLFMVAHEGAPTTYTWTDNKSTSGSNFVSLGTVDMVGGAADGDSSLNCIFCYTPNVGTGHTVTCTFGASRTFRYIGGIVLNGSFSSTFLAATTATALEPDGLLTVDAGSLVTDAAAYLIQFGFQVYDSQTISAAGSGWAIKDNVGPRHFQSRNEAASGTFDPSYTLTAGSGRWLTLAAAVKETAGGVFTPRRTLLGVG